MIPKSGHRFSDKIMVLQHVTAAFALRNAAIAANHDAGTPQ
jgi:hypothetical protein